MLHDTETTDHVSKQAKNAAKARKRNKPKKKCCVSQPRCKRCPLRMLAEGTLPAGYAVKHRKLIVVEQGDIDAGRIVKKPKKSKRKKRTTPDRIDARRAA